MKHLRFPALALLIVMVLMMILFVATPKSDYSASERRYLANAPEPDMESILDGELSEEVETYLSDHFPGRNFFVGVNAYWNLFTGRNAASSVYYGKDGYLIRSPEDGGTEQLEKNLSCFDGFASASGLPSTLIMIPTAGDVLEDKLPNNHAPYRYQECFKIAENNCGFIDVLELSEPLKEAAVNEQVYYKTDHHLTSSGCYTVYKELCRLKSKAPKEDYAVSSYEGFHGTTWTSSGYWLSPADTIETWESNTKFNVTISETGKDDVKSDSVFFKENLESDDLYTVFLDGNHELVHIQNPSAKEGSLLVIRDSYAHCLASFLAEDYKDIILVDLRYYRNSVSELIKKYNVTEIAFIYGLDSLLTDTNSAWLS